jgi:hypothetical protein
LPNEQVKVIKQMETKYKTLRHTLKEKTNLIVLSMLRPLNNGVITKQHLHWSVPFSSIIINQVPKSVNDIDDDRLSKGSQQMESISFVQRLMKSTNFENVPRNNDEYAKRSCEYLSICTFLAGYQTQNVVLASRNNILTNLLKQLNETILNIPQQKNNCSAMKCSKNHQLKEYVTPGGTCDVCGCHRTACTVMDCRQCNYWVCRDCYDGTFPSEINSEYRTYLTSTCWLFYLIIRIFDSKKPLVCKNNTDSNAVDNDAVENDDIIQFNQKRKESLLLCLSILQVSSKHVNILTGSFIQPIIMTLAVLIKTTNAISIEFVQKKGIETILTLNKNSRYQGISGDVHEILNSLIVEKSKITSRLRRMIVRNMRRHLLPKYGGHVKVSDILSSVNLVNWSRRYPNEFQIAASKSLLVMSGNNVALKNNLKDVDSGSIAAQSANSENRIVTDNDRTVTKDGGIWQYLEKRSGKWINFSKEATSDMEKAKNFKQSQCCVKHRGGVRYMVKVEKNKQDVKNSKEISYDISDAGKWSLDPQPRFTQLPSSKNSNTSEHVRYITLEDYDESVNGFDMKTVTLIGRRVHVKWHRTIRRSKNMKDGSEKSHMKLQENFHYEHYNKLTSGYGTVIKEIPVNMKKL